MVRIDNFKQKWNVFAQITYSGSGTEWNGYQMGMCNMMIFFAIETRVKALQKASFGGGCIVGCASTGYSLLCARTCLVVLMGYS